MEEKQCPKCDSTNQSDVTVAGEVVGYHCLDCDVYWKVVVHEDGSITSSWRSGKGR